jgi:hypothetical protein
VHYVRREGARTRITLTHGSLFTAMVSNHDLGQAGVETDISECGNDVALPADGPSRGVLRVRNVHCSAQVAVQRLVW